MPHVRAAEAAVTSLLGQARPAGSARLLPVLRTDRPTVDPAAQPAGSASLSVAGLALAKKASEVDGGAMRDAKVAKAGTDQPRHHRQPLPTMVGSGAVSPKAHDPAPGAHKAATSKDSVPIPSSLGPNDEARQVQRFGGLNVRQSTGGIALT